jgi:hypothetical protein
MLNVEIESIEHFAAVVLNHKIADGNNGCHCFAVR